MKLITAIIQMDKLDEVREALSAIGVTRITVSRAAGRGRQADEELHRGKIVIPDLIPKMRVDIACKDNDSKKICETIIRAARHGDGKIGDGKIFVTELLECIRIRTQESGEPAI
jgi:nitrogen regulatory protein P-II 1